MLVQLTVEDQALSTEKLQLNGSHLNPAFDPVLAAAPDTVKQFEDYDDTGVYNYGIFVRDRCSRCRRSRIVHCTKF